MEERAQRPIQHAGRICLSLLGPGVATGGPLTFEDVFNPNDVLFIRNGLHTLEFTHDLTVEGFDPLTDTLTDTTLSVYLRDDNDPSAEKVDITLDDLWMVQQRKDRVWHWEYAVNV